ncbi:hypothetical protein [Pseudomonas sp. S1(2024)]|uniref:hypothetical protein n=1 Tax=Pseudomonas sp. S1(2024) TaxID=3390191 RepID=UPI003978A2CF
MNLNHTPLIDASAEYKEALCVLPGSRGSSLTDFDRTLSQMEGDLKHQAMNWLLDGAFLWQKRDLLDYLVENGVTQQPGFFSDLSGALTLYTRVRTANLAHNDKILGFIALLQDYAATLGDEFKREAVCHLLPRSDRAMVVEEDYREEFEQHLDLFRMVFGKDVFRDPEIGNMLLCHIAEKPSHACKYGQVFTTLIKHIGDDFRFNDYDVTARLLEDKAYCSQPFFDAHQQCVAGLLSQLKRPAMHSASLVKLVSAMGHVVLPILAGDERLPIGSGVMSNLNAYLLYGKERGQAGLASHRQIHEALARRVLSHPAFASQVSIAPDLRSVPANPYAGLTTIVARQEGVSLTLRPAELESFSEMIAETRDFTAEDRRELHAFLKEQVGYEVLSAYERARKTSPENPIVCMMASLDPEMLVDACLIQVCYEQILKHGSKTPPSAADAPLLEAARSATRNNSANPHAKFYKATRCLVEQMDDARIMAHLPKNKRFAQQMVMSNLVKDRQYIALLTPRQQEDMLSKDLGL